jgi:hypothetical protein
MKKLLTLAVALVAFVAASHGQGVLKFKTESHDFGKVKEGDIAVFNFEFTNTGNAPIVISNARPSCGCTTPDWTREPIMPGKTGKVTASFNSAGRPGPFFKTVTVENNSETASVQLSIKGEVTPADPAAPAPAVTAAPAPAAAAVAAPAAAPKVEVKKADVVVPARKKTKS